MAIVFDADNFRIILDSATVTATELYSRWCDWAALADNAKYGAVFRALGGDDLAPGIEVPPYYFLQGAWRVRPMESTHTLTLTGNLFVEGGGDPIVPTLGNFNVVVKSVVPVQAQVVNTVTEVPAALSALDVANAVWAKALEGLTAEQIMRLLASFMAGEGVGLESPTPQFKSLDGSKVRLAANYANGTRTMTVVDGA